MLSGFTGLRVGGKNNAYWEREKCFELGVCVVLF